MRDYRSEADRTEDIVELIRFHQVKHPGTLFTHTFVQNAVVGRYGVSGTLVRKYIRHAIVAGQLSELRPSYDGSIGGLFIITGSPVYISPVKPEVCYKLSRTRLAVEHPRQLALIATPERIASALQPFVPETGEGG